MFKKFVAAAAAIALGVGLVALVASPASAHTHTNSATCSTGVAVDLQYYSSSTDHPTPNVVVVTVDNTVVVDHVAFGATFVNNYAWATPAPTHSYRVQAWAVDDPYGASGYSFDSGVQSVTGCTTAITAAAPSPTNPSCVAASTIGGGGYTIPSAQSGVTYQVLSGSTWSPVAAGPHGLAPGATVHLRAVPSSNLYTLSGTTTWDYTLTSPSGYNCVVPTPPTPAQSSCSTTTPGGHSTGSYTIPEFSAGVTYQVQTGATWTSLVAGTSYPVTTFPSTVVIRAVVASGYSTPANTTLQWTYNYSSAGECLFSAIIVQPRVTPPSCDVSQPGAVQHGTYTLTEVTGVDYTVTLNGRTTTVTGGGGGSLNPGDTLNIVAVAEPGYELSGPITGFPITVSSVGDCVVPVASGAVSYVDPICAAKPGSQTQGSYVVDAAAHVTYQVSVNNGPYTSISAGPHDTAAGDVITIEAVADEGYRIDPAPDPATLTHSFPQPGDCLTEATAIKPDTAGQSCVPDGELGAARSADVLTDASITIQDTVGVQYFIDDVAYDAGQVFLEPGDYKVTAMAKSGYQLDDSYPVGGWKVTLTSDEACGQLVDHPLVMPTVLHTDPSCLASGSYTLGNDLNDPAAITWTVNGSVVAAGPYTVGQGTYTIHAEANGPSYGFAQDAQTDWTFTLTAPTACDLKTLALTGSSPAGWIALGYLLLVSGLALIAVRLVRRRGEPQR